MAAKDTIFVRGESKPRAGVNVLAEGARAVAYEDGAGARHEVEGWRVRRVARGDTPAELDDALAQAGAGELAAAEKTLAALAARQKPAWLALEAGFLHANVRRLRAKLEGTGHAEALALLRKWRENGGKDH